MRYRFAAVLLVFGMLGAACASDEGTSTDPSTAGDASPSESMGSMDLGDSEEMTFGEPGDPAEADRTIEVTALDQLEFEPPSIEVQAGETITFRVTNSGSNRHEFVLGDESFQEMHEMEMEMEGQMMADEPFALVIEAGDTKELTWSFTESGQIIYGCHEPGHYDGGMKGTLNVS